MVAAVYRDRYRRGELHLQTELSTDAEIIRHEGEGARRRLGNKG